jgi:hypothetical protein
MNYTHICVLDNECSNFLNVSPCKTLVLYAKMFSWFTPTFLESFNSKVLYVFGMYAQDAPWFWCAHKFSPKTCCLSKQCMKKWSKFTFLFKDKILPLLVSDCLGNLYCQHWSSLHPVSIICFARFRNYILMDCRGVVMLVIVTHNWRGYVCVQNRIWTIKCEGCEYILLNFYPNSRSNKVISWR